MLSPQKLDKERILTTTSKDEIEGYFNLKTIRYNFMYAFFYLDVSKFDGNFEENIDERMYKRTIKIFTRLVGRPINSRLLMYQCWFVVVGFQKFSQFYDIIKKKYQILPRPYMVSYEGEKGNFLREKMIVKLSKSWFQ